MGDFFWMTVGLAGFVLSVIVADRFSERGFRYVLMPLYLGLLWCPALLYFKFEKSLSVALLEGGEAGTIFGALGVFLVYVLRWDAR